MKTYCIDSYEGIGPQSTSTNYIIHSDLARGEAQVHSPNFSTKMLLAGSERYESENNRFSIKRDQFLLTAPDEPFSLTIDTSAVGYCFYFDTDYIKSLMSELISEDLDGGEGAVPSMRTIRLPINSSRLGLSMLAIANNTLHADTDSLSTDLAETLINLSSLSAKLPCKREKTKQELLARLEIARTFIIDEQNNSITLLDISRASSLSCYHLNRSFSAAYGVPPLRFHQNLKLDAARKKIMAGFPQSMVAAEIGFSTTSSFSRAYRRRHNCSPLHDE